MPRIIRDRGNWARLFQFWKGVTYRPDEQYKSDDFHGIRSDDAPDLVKAYYGALLGSAEAVRSHAQAGATIATGAAGFIVAAGLFGGGEDAHVLVKVFGGLTFVLWLIAAYRFMTAVAAHGTFGRPERVAPSDGDAEAQTLAFAKLAVAVTRNERRELIQNAWYARLSAGVAMIFTIVTAVLALAVGPSKTEGIDGDLVLSVEAAKSVSACALPSPRERNHVQMESATVGDAMIAIEFQEGRCRGKTAVVPVEAIGAFYVRP